MGSVVNWGELNEDVLTEITKSLKTMENLVCFGEVCKSWRRVAMAAEEYCSFEGPWLMQIHKKQHDKHQEDGEKDINEDEAASAWREFISVSLGGKVRRLFLPELVNRNCLSCKDWLFTISEDNDDVSLFHPLSRTQIHLPNLKSMVEDYPIFCTKRSSMWSFVRKVVLSADPRRCSCTCLDNEQELTVMVMTGSKIYFCKPGKDTSWAQIGFYQVSFSHITYFNNKLYALDFIDNIFECDLYGPNPIQLLVFTPTKQIFISPNPSYWLTRYLVECCGKLLIVHRFFMKFPEIEESLREHKTFIFKVYETQFSDGPQFCLEELKDLGNKALFLGGGNTYSIDCSKFINVIPNSIYFMSETWNSSRNVIDKGIYNLSDGSITSFTIDENDVVLSQIAPPTWIGPSF